MAERKTTYQKLKEENLRLRQQIDILCENGIDAMEIRIAYNMRKQLEKTIWSGDPFKIVEFSNINHGR